MSTPVRSDMAQRSGRVAAVGVVALLLAGTVAAHAAFGLAHGFSEGWGVTADYLEPYPPPGQAAPQTAPAPTPAAPPPMGLGSAPRATVAAGGAAAEPYVDYTAGAGSESGGNYGFTAETAAPVTDDRGQRADGRR